MSRGGSARAVLMAGALAIVALGAPRPARASGTEEHRALMVAGQLLRADAKLLRARDLLADCERQSCDAGADEECASIRVFCKEKLAELLQEIPSVEVSVADDLGAPLPRAKAWIDNTLVSDDRPVPLDPGRHLLRADYLGRFSEVPFDVHRGDPKKQLRATVDLRRTITERPVPTWFYGLSATSGAGLLAFGAFALSAESQASSFGDCKPTCDQSKKSGFMTTTVVADVSLGIATLAALGATAVYLSRPRVERVVRLDESSASGAR